MANCEPTNADIGSTLTLRNDRGALFRGVVAGVAQSGAWMCAEAVNLGDKWERLSVPELRMVRGAEIVEETLVAENERLRWENEHLQRALTRARNRAASRGGRVPK